ncbi:hypothetical protein SVAN01_09703 [Stagonosporopsis vannaccii]|nr:hypothetical protein SVAN01_09703 [Stagonosporopsis vannaccii]
MTAKAPGGDVHSEETVLFLFLAFGLLVTLILILVLAAFQTYLSWRIASLLVEGGDGAVQGEKERRRERRAALKMLEKRASWAAGASASASATRVDEEMGMSGARGRSVLLDRMRVDGEKGKRGVWSLKRWF